jgi:DNA-binding NarL/FixJ family response regulator
VTLRVVIADDHSLGSEGLESMLSMADDVELAGTHGYLSKSASRESVIQAIRDVSEADRCSTPMSPTASLYESGQTILD